MLFNLRFLFWLKHLVSLKNSILKSCINIHSQKKKLYVDIDKIYNPPAAIKRQPTTSEENDTLNQKTTLDHYSSYFRRDLIGFKNFDLFRSTDLVVAMIMFYAIITPLLVQGKTGVYIAIVQAFFWRAIHSLGNGAILRAQSNNKFLTRHFIKWGGGVQEAFQNWKR